MHTRANVLNDKTWKQCIGSFYSFVTTWIVEAWIEIYMFEAVTVFKKRSIVSLQMCKWLVLFTVTVWMVWFISIWGLYTANYSCGDTVILHFFFLLNYLKLVSFKLIYAFGSSVPMKNQVLGLICDGKWVVENVGLVVHPSDSRNRLMNWRITIHSIVCNLDWNKWESSSNIIQTSGQSDCFQTEKNVYSRWTFDISSGLLLPCLPQKVFLDSPVFCVN